MMTDSVVATGAQPDGADDWELVSDLDLDGLKSVSAVGRGRADQVLTLAFACSRWRPKSRPFDSNVVGLVDRVLRRARP